MQYLEIPPVPMNPNTLKQARIARPARQPGISGKKWKSPSSLPVVAPEYALTGRFLALSLQLSR
jgi:predicted transcriptional regulator